MYATASTHSPLAAFGRALIPALATAVAWDATHPPIRHGGFGFGHQHDFEYARHRGWDRGHRGFRGRGGWHHPGRGWGAPRHGYHAPYYRPSPFRAAFRAAATVGGMQLGSQLGNAIAPGRLGRGIGGLAGALMGSWLSR